MLVINKHKISELVDPVELMNELEKALLMQVDGKITMPQRMHTALTLTGASTLSCQGILTCQSPTDLTESKPDKKYKVIC